MTGNQLEEAIVGALTGVAQEHALAFAGFLRERGALVEGAGTYWEAVYQGEPLCFIWVDGGAQAPGPWTIWSDQESGSWASWPGSGSAACPVDEATKLTAWANVNPCTGCGGCGSPGTHKTVLGRGFANLCSSTMAFTNPDAVALACAKKMVDVRLEDLQNMRGAS